MNYMKFGPHTRNLPAEILAEFAAILVDVSRRRDSPDSPATQDAMPEHQQHERKG